MKQNNQHRVLGLAVLLALFALFSAVAYADSDSLSVTFDVYSSNYSNTTINLVANQSRTITASVGGVNTTVSFTTNSNVTNGSLQLYTTTTNPRTTAGIGSEESSFNRFIDIRPSASINNSLNTSQIRVYYADSDLVVDGKVYRETSLAIYYWNESASGWVAEASQGVDATNNYVYATVSHFSLFGVFGTLVDRGGNAETPPSTGGSPGGGGAAVSCTEDWMCDSWSACSASGTQTRKCYDFNDCGTAKNKPKEQQSCALPAAAQLQAAAAPMPASTAVAPASAASAARKIVPLSTSMIVLGAVALLILIIFVAMGKKTRRR